MIRDQIHDTSEYQELTATAEETQQAAATATVAAGSGTVGQTLGPVLSWEKNDVEFWLQVAQLIALYLILRELRRA